MEITDANSLKSYRNSAPQPEEALTVLRSLASAEIVDSEFHRHFAHWAEELEEPELALREWNLALRDRPNDPGVLRALTEVHLDAGALEKAARCLTLLTRIDPEDGEIWAELIECTVRQGKLEEAEALRQRAVAITGEVRFQRSLSPLATRVEPQPDELDDAFLVSLQELFRGREGVYARQWLDPDGRTGYNPIREPASIKVFRNHILGNHTIGIYPLRMDNTVFFATIDIDLAPQVVKACEPNSKAWSEATTALNEYAQLLQERAAAMGLPLYRADSGYKGQHLWAFFEEPITGRLARRMNKIILSGLSAPPVLSVEIFPKQSSVPKDGLGNLIKIPLGVHRKTSLRAWFIGAEPNLPEQRRFLQKIEKITLAQLTHCLESSHSLDPSTHELSLPSPNELSAESSRASSNILAQDYHLGSDQELQLLLGRCVTLRTLTQSVEQTGNLSHDEARVLLHTIGHLETGPLAVNTYLSRRLESESSLYLKKPLRGNPMSCAKIRSRIPEVTSQLPCDCQFAQSAALYPTPLLHLSQRTQGPGLERLQFQALLQDYLRTKRELHRLHHQLELYGERLAHWFEELGVEELETALGTLRLLKSEEGDTRFELSV